MQVLEDDFWTPMKNCTKKDEFLSVAVDENTLSLRHKNTKLQYIYFQTLFIK